MSVIHAHVQAEHGRQTEARDHREQRGYREIRREPTRPVIRDHRDRDRDRDGDRDRGYQRERPAFFRRTLLGATPLASGEVSVNCTGDLAGASTLELESTGAGSTYVSQVILYTADGGYQVENVNAMLSPSNPTLELALPLGASIIKVGIDGHSEWGGSISLELA